MNRTLLFCLLWAECVSSPQVHMLNPRLPGLQNVTILGEGIFKFVIKLKWGHWGNPNPIWLVSSYEQISTQTLRGMTMWGHRQETAIYTSGREASGESSPATPWPQLPASRPVRQYISVAYIAQSGVLSYGHPSRLIHWLSRLFVWLT